MFFYSFCNAIKAAVVYPFLFLFSFVMLHRNYAIAYKKGKAFLLFHSTMFFFNLTELPPLSSLFNHQIVSILPVCISHSTSIIDTNQYTIIMWFCCCYCFHFFLSCINCARKYFCWVDWGIIYALFCVIFE